MKKYLLIDNVMGFENVYDTFNEVLESCGCEEDKMTFEEFVRDIDGGDYSIEIIEGIK
jgi:hypothetical protein